MDLKSQLFYLQELESMEHFKLMLMEYLVYYNIILFLHLSTP